MQQQILENEEGKRRTLKLLKLETNLSDETLLNERPPFPEKVETVIDFATDASGLAAMVNASFYTTAQSLIDDKDAAEEIEARIQKAGIKFGDQFLAYEPMKIWLDWATTDPSMERYCRGFYDKEGETFLAQNLAPYFW